MEGGFFGDLDFEVGFLDVDLSKGWFRFCVKYLNRKGKKFNYLK